MTQSARTEATSGTTAGAMRNFMAGFPTGVGVITSLDAAAMPWGMTCTSVASVALDPPTLLVCLRRGSPTLEAALRSRTFALNLLHADARPTAELFASGDPERFSRSAWSLPPGCGGPHLDFAAHAVADCRILQGEPVGDHVVLFGEVVRATGSEEPVPLLYGMRQYAGWSLSAR